MLNIHDLEKRWIRYKIKSFIPYIALILSSIFILTAGVFFLSQDTKKNITATDKNLSSQKTVVKVTNQTVKKPKENKTLKSITPKRENNVSKQELIAKAPLFNPHKTESKAQTSSKNTRTLKPQMSFIENIKKDDTPSYTIQQATPKREKRAQEKTKLEKKHKVVAPIQKPQEEYIDLQESTTITQEKNIQQQEAPKEQVTQNNTIEDEPKVEITIKRKESEQDIKEVIKRFQKNNNPALSLFVAKQYYALGNYKQAYNYALITNKINNEIDDSWIIFAKSLVKLGKKDQAIKTLREYIKFSHSSNAQVLLDEIQRGKFR